MSPSPHATPRQPPDIRDWLRRLSRTGGPAASLAVALPIAAGVLLLPQAWLLAHVLDRVIAGREALGVLVLPVSAMAGLMILRISLGLLGESLASGAAQAAKTRARAAIFGGIMGEQPTWTAARPSGALAGLLTEQVEAMEGYLTRYLPAMALAALLPIAFAVVLFPVDWVVALLLLIAAPLIPLFMALAGWGAEAASKRQATALSRLSGYFADRLRGLTTLKLFGRETEAVEGVAAASEELRVRTMRVMRIAFLSSAVLEFFAALGVAGVALYVGLTFLHLVTLRGSPLSLEAGLFCLLMAPEVFQPLRLLAAHYHDQAGARAAAEEIATQLGGLPRLGTEATFRSVAPLRRRQVPALALAEVAIAAPDGRAVLSDASLKIAAGEHVAILGTSGSGKSTLLEAIAGLRPYDGSIRLDAVEVSSFDPGALHAGLAMLGQRATVFAGSIAENIRLGRQSATPEEVRSAARRARVVDFAAQFPGGLATPLGENGLGLSGGEVHRVALARLYLRDAGLLLLDEPTAHLDGRTEAAVLDGLIDFARGRTMIVATHSLAVAARMDRCYRLVDGRLVPAGIAGERGAA